MSVPSGLWKRILETLEETLQLGFLEETHYVTEVVQHGSELYLCVPPRSAEADRAFAFLSQSGNTQRILILAKRLHTPTAELPAIESVIVVQEMPGGVE